MSNELLIMLLVIINIFVIIMIGNRTLWISVMRFQLIFNSLSQSGKPMNERRNYHAYEPPHMQASLRLPGNTKFHWNFRKIRRKKNKKNKNVVHILDIKAQCPARAFWNRRQSTMLRHHRKIKYRKHILKLMMKEMPWLFYIRVRR